jgi:hypothetical protein
MHEVVSDVPVDDEEPLVTLGISRSVGAQSFGGAHRGRVCVRVFIGVSVRASALYCVILKKTKALLGKDFRRPTSHGISNDLH